MEYFFKIADQIQHLSLLKVIVIGIIYWTGKYLEPYFKKKLERSAINTAKNEFAIALKQLVTEIGGEYGANKAFVIYHDTKNKNYSVIHEYSPRMVRIEQFYKEVPFDEQYEWAIKSLEVEDMIICNNISEVGHSKHQNQMKAFKFNSWYCLALRKYGSLVGSFNIYFKKPSAMTDTDISILTGKLSLMGNLLYKQFNSK